MHNIQVLDECFKYLMGLRKTLMLYTNVSFQVNGVIEVPSYKFKWDFGALIHPCMSLRECAYY